MTSFSFEIPTVETERLILRAAQESDLDALAVFNQSERSHLIGGPLDRAGCWKVISNVIGPCVASGCGTFTIKRMIA